MTYTIHGIKYYPVCSWEQNQHKLYNAHDREFNKMFDAENDKVPSADFEKISDELDEIDRLISVFSDYVIDGIVYATYEDCIKIKDYIAAYNCRH